MINGIDLTNRELKRLIKEKNMWLATLRNNNQPHLVPLWFLYLNSKIYMCTAENSTKIRNIKRNSQATVSLEDTFKAFIIECKAKIISSPFPKDIVEGYGKKFDWDISSTENSNVLIELTPIHKIAFNDDK
ncbi:MAG: hypothetical protein HeimC2_08280 [Candidatus Heimdallarchaeota archaeon LC_2]|nr:MAG: hypothetical protein HeimC2_08280 [Candidatus Heimdallarchaeota archaeon LC_2]